MFHSVDLCFLRFHVVFLLLSFPLGSLEIDVVLIILVENRSSGQRQILTLHHEGFGDLPIRTLFIRLQRSDDEYGFGPFFVFLLVLQHELLVLSFLYLLQFFVLVVLLVHQLLLLLALFIVLGVEQHREGRKLEVLILRLGF